MLPKYAPQTQSLPTSNIPTMVVNPLVRMAAPPGIVPPVSAIPGHQPLMNVQVSAPHAAQPGPRPLMGNIPGFPPRQQPLFNMPPRGPVPLLQQPQGPPINPAIRMQQGVLGAPPGNPFAQRMQMGGPRPR